MVPPQDDFPQKQSQEETTQRQHDDAAMLLFCRGMCQSIDESPLFDMPKHGQHDSLHLLNES